MLNQNKSLPIQNFIKGNYGVNSRKQTKLFVILGLNIRSRLFLFKRKHIFKINKCMQTILVLRSIISKNILFSIKNKTYKGIRQKLKYPARGQRTHTNAKTKKKFKY
jgi:ribosomal protein S13